MRTNKPARPPDSKGLRSNDLASLKRLRSAAQHTAQAVVPAAAPLPKRKRVAQEQQLAASVAQARQLTASIAPVRSADKNVTDDKTLPAVDISLFRQAMKTVTPMKGHQRVLAGPLPAASAQMLTERRQHATGDTNAPLAVQVSDHYMAAHTDQDDRVFVRSPDAGDLVKGLKRGKWPVQASLDLHGCTLDDARERLDRFLQSCLDHQLRSVRIVHGKGYGSRNGTPILKDVVRRWLTQLAAVQAYIECKEVDGGAGAVQVLLSLTAPRENVHP
ncbi:MAG: Smr/MutS family protein [Burkholderiaceae bacterium]|nr:Smr/MutS family protein [Burkholderiaceae bacterium]